MKFKRVKNQILQANSKHVMLEGVEGKTIVITSLEFFSVVRSKNTGSDVSRDDVALTISSKNGNNTIVPLGAHSIGGAATPLYIASDERLVISASGDQYGSTGKHLNYLITYQEAENA